MPETAEFRYLRCCVVYVCCAQVFDVNGKFLRKFGSQGDAPGQQGVAFHQGRLLVADYYNQRVHVFKPDGSFIMAFAVDGSPYSLCVDAQGRVIVGTNAYKVHVFCLT